MCVLGSTGMIFEEESLRRLAMLAIRRFRILPHESGFGFWQPSKHAAVDHKTVDALDALGAHLGSFWTAE